MQTKNRKNLQAWKAFVRSIAQAEWPTTNIPLSEVDLRFTIVYLCDAEPADIDNIIKPIQDALVGLVYVDDALITDVDSHRRYLDDIFEFSKLPKLPKLLQDGVVTNEECVYVRVADAEKLWAYL